MRHVVGSFVTLGLWFLFYGIATPSLFSDQYIMGIIGVILIGSAVAIMFGRYEDNRKEDVNARAQKNADEYEDEPSRKNPSG